MADMDLDELTAKIATMLKRRAPDDDDDHDDYDDARGKVPVSRLRREIDKRKRLEEQLSELGTAVEDLRTGYSTKLDEIKASAAEQVTNISKSHNEDLKLVEMGVKDPFGRQAVRQAWEALPKGERGDSPSTWFGSSIEALTAHRADPETVEAPNIPRTLVGYLPEPPADPPKSNGRARTSGGPPPGPGARQPSSVDNVPTDQGIEAFLSGLNDLG